MRKNEFGQPVGDDLPVGWTQPPKPSRQVIEGPRVLVEPIDPERHAEGLYAAIQQDRTGESWTYMPFGPFGSCDDFRGWMERGCLGDDPLYFAYVDKATGQAIGSGAYMRIKPGLGCIEVGSIHLSPTLQRTPMATEVMHLMMKTAFDLGYRRYEWKCDALNAPSRRAAERLGFTYEGTFRQAIHYKGRNRDTAWYAIIDKHWPAICAAQEAWLEASNFDGEGTQRRPLAAFMTDRR